MANTFSSFNKATPEGWSKIRNICLIVVTVASWFVTTGQTTPALGIPDIVMLWVGVLASFASLLAVIAQSQGVITTPPKSGDQLGMFDDNTTKDVGPKVNKW